jgi:hypothetical protein
MIYALHKLRHFLLGNKIVFYKPHGFGILGQQTIGIYKDNQMVVIFKV